MDVQCSLDEVGLIPARISTIKSRSHIDPYANLPECKLPIFVSPMTCILNDQNLSFFNDSLAIPIRPVRAGQSVLRSFYDGWEAVTLNNFREYFCASEDLPEDKNYKILIDVADGHMEDLYKVVKKAKLLHPGKLTIMIGNIANPEAYEDCCKASVDYVRVGIGGGSGCTTSTQTGFHASMSWILTEIKNWKEEHLDAKFLTKVIADGGVNSIAKAIKCLALGADYVMMGRCFAQTEESCGQPYGPGRKLYYGQSSERGQLDRFGYVKSNPEGCEQVIDVLYPLRDFLLKFEACLRSAMSYAGARTLDDFIGKVKWVRLSQSEVESFMK